MRKPILIIKIPTQYLNPDEVEAYKNYVTKKIDKEIPKEEYHRLVFFGNYNEPKIELLQKGRNHKTIRNLSKLLK